MLVQQTNYQRLLHIISFEFFCLYLTIMLYYTFHKTTVNAFGMEDFIWVLYLLLIINKNWHDNSIILFFSQLLPGECILIPVHFQKVYLVGTMYFDQFHSVLCNINLFLICKLVHFCVWGLLFARIVGVGEVLDDMGKVIFGLHLSLTSSTYLLYSHILTLYNTCICMQRGMTGVLGK